MRIETTRFGEIEYNDEEVFLFEQGIPGFKEECRYVLIAEENNPFMYLQSVDRGELSFIVVSPFDFFEQYEFVLPDAIQDELELTDSKQVKIVNIVKVKDDLSTALINLGAPVVLNTARRKGLQYILPESRYSIQQPLFGEIIDNGGGQ